MVDNVTLRPPRKKTSSTLSDQPFEYDLFLSFAAADLQFVRSIWENLNAHGLRVFWSDYELKGSIGQSFFSVIQNALTKSRHFILVGTPNSLTSGWVEAEYETFYSQCYIPSRRQRRLIIFEAPGFKNLGGHPKPAIKGHLKTGQR